MLNSDMFPKECKIIAGDFFLEIKIEDIHSNQSYNFFMLMDKSELLHSFLANNFIRFQNFTVVFDYFNILKVLYHNTDWAVMNFQHVGNGFPDFKVINIKTNEYFYIETKRRYEPFYNSQSDWYEVNKKEKIFIFRFDTKIRMCTNSNCYKIDNDRFKEFLSEKQFIPLSKEEEEDRKIKQEIKEMELEKLMKENKEQVNRELLKSNDWQDIDVSWGEQA